MNVYMEISEPSNNKQGLIKQHTGKTRKGISSFTMLNTLEEIQLFHCSVPLCQPVHAMYAIKVNVTDSDPPKPT